MGFLELKTAPSLSSKSSVGNSATTQSGTGFNASQTEPASGKHLDSGSSIKDQILRTKPAEGKSERTESISVTKSDSGQVKLKVGSLANGLDGQSSLPSSAVQSGSSRSMENQKQADESSNGAPDENAARVGESRTTVKRSVPVGSLSKPSKQDSLKDDGRSGNAVTRTSGSSSSDKDLQTYASEGRYNGTTNISSSANANGNAV